MEAVPKIIIIGAGLIGLCTAEALAARGSSVTVIEARSGPCEGTSFSNSGMIHPSQALSWEPGRMTQSQLDAAQVTAELGARSHMLLLRQMKGLGLPLRPRGCLQIFPDLKGATSAQKRFNAIGVEANIVMDPVDAFGQTACRFPNDGSGDAFAFGRALAVDLETRGVDFIYAAENLDIRRADGGFDIRVSARVLKADHLVIAAGINTPDLLAQMDVRMQLKGISGAAADFALPEEREDIPSCPVMDFVSRSAMTAFEDRLRIAGGQNLTDPASLIERWTDLAPELMRRLGKPISTWSGVRPVSPIGRPYISATSIPKLWVNTGHGHMGWTLCAGSGELLAQMILEGHKDRRFVFSG